MTEIKPPPPEGCLKPFLAISCTLPVHLINGSIFGQSAGMLPQLMRQDSLIRIDREEATWIASMAVIGTFISATICASLSDMFGRIRMCQVSYLFFAVGYAVMVCAENLRILLLGRFLVGAAVGFSFPASVYISEAAPPAYRGIFLSICPTLASTGLIYMYIFGGYLPWRIAAASTCIISILGLCLTFLCYDSPPWLVRNNKIEEARKSLQQIEHPANVEARLKELQEIAASQAQVEPISIKTFVEPTVWKPLLTVIALSVLQNGSGFYIIIYYTVNFMEEFQSIFDPLQVTIAIGIVRLISMILSSYSLRTMGRQTIGAVSGFCSAIILLLISAYLHYEKTFPFLSENSWIPICLFLTFILSMTFGIFALPWIMPYELFPIKVRGLMCGVSFSSMYFIMFFGVKLYNVLMDGLGLEGLILMFAANSMVFGIFSVTLLVETHRKTLDEIEREFLGGKTQTKEKTKTEQVKTKETMD